MLVAAAAAAAACQSAAGFSCSDNDDCQSGDLDGTCELNGLCSFPDQDCESGQRYGQASGALAGDCVPPTSGTDGETDTSPVEPTSNGPVTSTTLPGTSSGTSPQASSDAGSGSVSSTTSTDELCGNGDIDDGEMCDDAVNDGAYGGCSEDCQSRGPFCGDGIRNGDELCDDANDENADGCNIDCIESGTRLWVADEPPGLNHGRAVAVGPDDIAYVTGLQNNIGSPSQHDVYVGAVDADGTTLWEDVWDSGMEFDNAQGIAVDDRGQIHVVGGSSVGDANVPFVRVYNRNGGVAGNAEGLEDNAVDLTGIGIASRDGAVAVVGATAGGQFSESIARAWGLSDALAVDWQTDLIGHGALSVGGAAFGPNGDLLVATHGGNALGESAVLFRINTVGAPTFSWDLQWPTETSRRITTGVAVDSMGDIYVSGYLEDAQSSGYLAKVSGAGDNIWSVALDPDDGFFLGVAVDGDDRPIVVGAVRQSRDGNDFDGLIIKYETTGDMLWSIEHDSEQVQNGSDTFLAVAVDSSDHILVAGSEDRTNFGDPLSVYLAKYAP